MLNNKKIIIIAVGVIILAATSYILIFGRKTVTPEEVELEMWGAFDDSDVFQDLITNFNVAYPYIKISYYKKNSQTYEKELLEAMASGRGPDIFVIHNTWLPRYKNKIALAPVELLTLKSYQEGFVDVAVDDFVSDGLVAAVPLSVDTLALYYNKDIFNTVGIAEPPKTWDEFLSDVERITLVDERDNVLRAGAAIGTARNINRSTDILCLLMLQSGTKMMDKQNDKVAFSGSVSLAGETFYPGERSLQFYTDFANPLKSVYTWNTRMHYSIDAFYEGTAAMLLNYSYNLPVIRAKAPYLNFGVAKMPQIELGDNEINYANYWGLTVASQSKHSQAAWTFNVWLSQKENYQKYLELTQRPTARRDLVNWQKNDLDLGVFSEQALTAKSWHQIDNASIETILADMIESVVLGDSTVGDSLKKAAGRIDLLTE